MADGDRTGYRPDDDPRHTLEAQGLVLIRRGEQSCKPGWQGQAPERSDTRSTCTVREEDQTASAEASESTEPLEQLNIGRLPRSAIEPRTGSRRAETLNISRLRFMYNPVISRPQRDAVDGALMSS